MGLQLSPGQWISAGQELFALVDDVNLEARVDILESDLGQIAKDRPALVAIPALAETLQVKLDVISPALDVDTRSCEGLMRIQDESGRVRPGMFVRTAIAGAVLPGRLLVPREAILTRDGRPLVFKVEDDISQWLYVELGERNERFVEIKKVLQGGSLAPGERVVVSNHLTLTHGAKVKIKKTLTPSVPWKLAEGDAP
jgi:RND family efflux transporter MFP subunit